VIIESLVPNRRVDLDALIGEVKAAPRLRPFSEELLDFCGRFAAALGRDAPARRFPELTALAFWMRRAELSTLARGFDELQNEDLIRVPRGLVLHIPPANVDVMFVYSWFLSLLCGNRNIVRLSPSHGEPAAILCRILENVMAASSHPALRGGNALISYGHESEINTALSAACDTRVLWGGDDSVKAFRQSLLSPRASEIVFGDRFSFSVLRADAVLGLEETALSALAGRFFNDAFWFHQLGCSSPRLIVWCGSEGACRSAGDRLFPQLLAVAAEKGYSLAPSARMLRFTFECEAAIDRPIIGHRNFGSTFTCLRVSTLEGFDRRHCGAGLFFEYYATDLRDLGVLLEPKDQTLTHFGFTREELRAAALGWNGQGVDRLVPVGSGLKFTRHWDGMDLLEQLTRCVTIET
jgi:hypothetical protein